MSERTRPARRLTRLLLDVAVAGAFLLVLVTAAWGWFWSTFEIESPVTRDDYRAATLSLALVAALTALSGLPTLWWLGVSRWVRGLGVLVMVGLWVATALAGLQISSAPANPVLSAEASNPLDTVWLTLICATWVPLVVFGLAAGATGVRATWSRGPRSRRARSSAPDRRPSAAR